MSTLLSHEALIKLREANIISENEVAYAIGDKYIAEDVISKKRRIVEIPQNIIENKTNRRVLKG